MDEDSGALGKTAKLMDFLADITAAVNRDPVTDILADEAGAPETIVWLDELPKGIRLTNESAVDSFLRVTPPIPPPRPELPRELDRWTEIDPDTAEQRLLRLGPTDHRPEDRSPPPEHILRLFDKWNARLTRKDALGRWNGALA
jgi:hypothetical protein